VAEALLSLFAKIAVPLFFAGMAASALVVIVSLIRFVREVSTSDEEKVTDLS